MGVSPERFREVLGTFATGVTVVTFRQRDGSPAGLTVNAFSSLSLEPRLVLVCVDHGSRSHPHMMNATSFAVNVLSDRQERLAVRFTRNDLDGSERFEGVRWRPAPSGAPIIEDCLSFLDCALVERHEGGDHTIFIGEVRDAGMRGGEPLLYYRGSFGRWQPAGAGASHP